VLRSGDEKFAQAISHLPSMIFVFAQNKYLCKKL
jgi:hypothetical protein